MDPEPCSFFMWNMASAARFCECSRLLEFTADKTLWEGERGRTQTLPVKEGRAGKIEGFAGTQMNICKTPAVFWVLWCKVALPIRLP